MRFFESDCHEDARQATPRVLACLLPYVAIQSRMAAVKAGAIMREPQWVKAERPLLNRH